MYVKYSVIYVYTLLPGCSEAVMCFLVQSSTMLPKALAGFDCKRTSIWSTSLSKLYLRSFYEPHPSKNYHLYGVIFSLRATSLAVVVSFGDLISATTTKIIIMITGFAIGLTWLIVQLTLEVKSKVWNLRNAIRAPISRLIDHLSVAAANLWIVFRQKLSLWPPSPFSHSYYRLISYNGVWISLAHLSWCHTCVHQFSSPYTRHRCSP